MGGTGAPGGGSWISVAMDSPVSGAKAAMYQTWPPIDRPNQFAGSIESYELAASDIGGEVFPARLAALLAPAARVAFEVARQAVPVAARVVEDAARDARLRSQRRIAGEAPVGAFSVAADLAETAAAYAYVRCGVRAAEPVSYGWYVTLTAT